MDTRAGGSPAGSRTDAGTKSLCPLRHPIPAEAPTDPEGLYWFTAGAFPRTLYFPSCVNASQTEALNRDAISYLTAHKQLTKSCLFI